MNLLNQIKAKLKAVVTVAAYAPNLGINMKLVIVLKIAPIKAVKDMSFVLFNAISIFSKYKDKFTYIVEMTNGGTKIQALKNSLEKRKLETKSNRRCQINLPIFNCC